MWLTVGSSPNCGARAGNRRISGGGWIPSLCGVSLFHAWPPDRHGRSPRVRGTPSRSCSVPPCPGVHPRPVGVRGSCDSRRFPGSTRRVLRIPPRVGRFPRSIPACGVCSSPACARSGFEVDPDVRGWWSSRPSCSTGVDPRACGNFGAGLFFLRLIPERAGSVWFQLKLPGGRSPLCGVGRDCDGEAVRNCAAYPRGRSPHVRGW